MSRRRLAAGQDLHPAAALATNRRGRADGVPVPAFDEPARRGQLLLVAVFVTLLTGRFSPDRVSSLPAVELRLPALAVVLVLFVLWRVRDGARTPTVGVGHGAVLLTCWAGYMALSVLWAPADARTHQALVDLAVMAVLVLLALDVAARLPPAALEGVWTWLVVAGLVFLVAAVAVGPGPQGRFAAPGGGPNVFVRVMVLAALATVYLSRARGRLWLLWLLPAFLLGAVLSGSRGGLLALVVVLVAAARPLAKAVTRRIAARLLLVAALTAVAVWRLVDPQVLDLLYQRFVLQTFEQGYTSGREDIAAQAAALYGSAPVVGVGLDGYHGAVGVLTGVEYPHNLVLATAAEGGAVGLLLLTLAVSAFALPVLTRRPTPPAALFLLLSGGYLFVASLFSGDYYDARLMWLFLGLAAVRARMPVARGPAAAPSSGSGPAAAPSSAHGAVEFGAVLDVLRRRWRAALVAAGCVMVVVGVVTVSTAPVYSASARVLFSAAPASTPTLTGGGAVGRQLPSVADVAVSPLVLDPVITRLRLPETPATLARTLTVSVAGEAPVLEVAARDADPGRARQVADAVARQLAAAAPTLVPPGPEPVVATMHAPAAVPARPTSPNVPLDVAAGAALAVLLGVVVAVLRDRTDRRVRDDRDVDPALPVLARLPGRPRDSDLADCDLGDAAHPPWLRELGGPRPLLGDGEPPRRLVVTSSVAGEGGPAVARGLALTLAAGGARVVLVEADLRSGASGAGGPGLSGVLTGSADVGDAVRHRPGSTLDVLGPGRVPPAPGELLASTRAAHLLDDLAARYDVVVVSAPPALPFADAQVLAGRAAGTLVVAGVGIVRKDELATTAAALAGAGARLLGVVLTGVPRGAGRTATAPRPTTATHHPPRVNRTEHRT